jgi:glycosyltransferase involved in cell wall biosynthesis
MAAAGRAPTLSIGIPVRNGARYLADTLDCLSKQEFEDIEILVSDNASDDATPDIIRSAAAHDPRIRHVRQNGDIGPHENFNYVFRHTRSEFFSWLACDDLFEPNFYTRMIEFLRRRPEAAAAMSRLMLIDSDGDLMHHSDEGVTGDHPDPITRFIRYAGFSHFCQYTYAVARRSAMERTRLLAPFWGGDRLYCAELALTGPLLRDPDTLFYVRQHAERQTRRIGRRDPAATNAFLTPRGSRAFTLYYSRQLWVSLRDAELSEAERARGRRALWAWTIRHAPRLVRSAGRATLEVVNSVVPGRAGSASVSQ